MMHGQKNITYIGLYGKNPLFLSDFLKHEFWRQTAERYSDTKFHENPFCGIRIFPCGRTDM